MIVGNRDRGIAWFSGIVFAFLILVYGGPVVYFIIKTIQPKESTLAAVLQDAGFYRAVGASIAFASLSTLLQAIVALLLALILSERIHGTQWLSGIIVSPFFVPTIVIVLAWQFLSDPQIGLLTKLVGGTGELAASFRGRESAFTIMVITAVYEGFPFVFLLLLGRLSQVDPLLYHLADLNKLSYWNRFTSISWPAVREIFLSLLCLRFVVAFLKFEIPWIVYAHKEQFAPTDTVAVYLFRVAFLQWNTGKAYAASLLLLLLAGIVTMVVWLMYSFLKKENEKYA